MKIYNGFNDLRLRPRRRAVAIGVFDGVHKGHRRILLEAVREAARLEAVPAVVTFDPDPSRVLRPGHNHPILLSLGHRLKFMAQLGIREVVLVRFNKRFSRVRPEVFLERDLRARLGLVSLSVGTDFRFGKNAAAGAEFLRRAASKCGFALRLTAPVRSGALPISSTRIRRLVERGRLKDAARLLGREVSVSGSVIRGRGRGRKLGYPTANLNPHHETLPPRGVYAGWASLGGRRVLGMVHIGARPTFGEADPSLEVHFLDFRGDLYGREVEIFFLRRLRPIRRFRDPEALLRAIRRDEAVTRRLA